MAREPIVNVATLRRLKAFPWASDQQLKKLITQMVLQHVERRTTLGTTGTPSEDVYLLVSGVIKLSLPNVAEEDELVSLIGPGELFGVTALMPNTRQTFRCEAFSDCWVGRMPPAAFVSSLLGVPFADFSALMGSTVAHWFDLLYRSTHFQGLSLRERLILALLELARKFGVPDARGTSLILRLTYEDFADLIGASRQNVAEHLKELERQELILRDGHRLIVHPSRLQEMVHPGPGR